MRLVSLCASHLDRPKRLEHLHRMLDSWNVQTEPVQLYISLSANPDVGDAGQIANRLQRLYGSDLVVYPSQQQCSQFTHYRRLCDMVPTKRRKGSWVLFTDDDDLWHPRRVKAYRNALRTLEEHNISHKIAHIALPAAFSGSKEPTIEDFENMSLDQTGPPKLDVNYIALCCRFAHLRQFVQQCDDELLNWRLCDVLFNRFLQIRDQQDFPGLIIRTSWPLYFYRQDDRTTNSTNTANLEAKDWDDNVDESGRYALCLHPCTVQEKEVADWLIDIQTRHDPSMGNPAIKRAAEDNFRKIVNRLWHSQSWKRIRDFPSVDMSIVTVPPGAIQDISGIVLPRMEL